MSDTSKKLEFLFLSQEDMIEAGVVDMKRCVQCMDDVFKLMGDGDYLMGSPWENHHGMMLWFPKEPRAAGMPVEGPDRRFMAMPAYLGGRFHVCGNKWYGSNTENAKRGLPRSILTVILNDVETGAPLALMSANLLSAARTGAVPGVATKYLQRQGAAVVGVVGAGVMGRSSLLSIAQTLDTGKEVLVYDIFPEKARSFCDDLGKQMPGWNIHPAGTMNEALGCDIVSVTASALAPVPITDDVIKPGAVVIITGAADVDDHCYQSNTIVFDNWKMHKEWLDELGDQPERAFHQGAGHPSAPLLNMVHHKKLDPATFMSLPEVIADPRKGRRSDDQKLIFISGGMAVEDVGWGFDCYQEALKKGLGQKLALWEAPYWS